VPPAVRGSPRRHGERPARIPGSWNPRGVEERADLLGHRSKQAIRLHPAVSYTELEHHTATQLGIPTLVFVLADDAQGPAAMFRDTKHGARQDGRHL
jgi:hypothetical protein